jgi:hypothetical protein
VSRFLSPLMLLAGLWLGVGITPLAAQDVVGPKPRMVGEEKKQPPKPELPKPEEPGKLKFEPVVQAKGEQKEEAKDEPKKDEPKKDEAPGSDGTAEGSPDGR